MFADVCAEKAIVNGETEASTNLRHGAGVIGKKSKCGRRTKTGGKRYSEGLERNKSCNQAKDALISSNHILFAVGRAYKNTFNVEISWSWRASASI